MRQTLSTVALAAILAIAASGVAFAQYSGYSTQVGNGHDAGYQPSLYGVTAYSQSSSYPQAPIAPPRASAPYTASGLPFNGQGGGYGK